MADLELARQLRGLADFLPIFERSGFTFGTWVDSVESAPGVWTVPYVEFSLEASAFHKAAARNGWVRPTIDWMAWGSTPEARAFESDTNLVSQATPEQLAHLLTYLIRGDRFSEGLLLGAFESGLLTRIVRRAGVLAAELDGRP